MLTGFPAEGGSSSGSAVVPYTFTNRDVMLYASEVGAPGLFYPVHTCLFIPAHFTVPCIIVNTRQTQF